MVAARVNDCLYLDSVMNPFDKIMADGGYKGVNHSLAQAANRTSVRSNTMDAVLNYHLYQCRQGRLDVSITVKQVVAMCNCDKEAARMVLSVAARAGALRLVQQGRRGYPAIYATGPKLLACVGMSYGRMLKMVNATKNQSGGIPTHFFKGASS